mgnify:CR=1 FL=1
MQDLPELVTFGTWLIINISLACLLAEEVARWSFSLTS